MTTIRPLTVTVPDSVEDWIQQYLEDRVTDILVRAIPDEDIAPFSIVIRVTELRKTLGKAIQITGTIRNLSDHYPITGLGFCLHQLVRITWNEMNDLHRPATLEVVPIGPVYQDSGSTRTCHNCHPDVGAGTMD